MRRRDFVLTCAAGGAGVAALGRTSLVALAEPLNPKTGFLISKTGCSAATAHPAANKIVTAGGKTHVGWVDSDDDGFHVRVRTLDRQTGRWSPGHKIGAAYDNHGGPALAIDSQGFLHAVYYPHHHPFRYRRSAMPNDASEWEDEVSFGERCTYPSLVCGRDDTLYLACRESGGPQWVMNLYVKPPDDTWQGPTALVRAGAGGYAHFHQSLAWGPDHRTLHLFCVICDGDPLRSHTIGYLRSPDSGQSWERQDGTRVSLPATAERVSVVEHFPDGGLSCGSIGVDPSGTPHLVYGTRRQLPLETWIARPNSTGGWQKRPLSGEVAGLLPGAGWGPYAPCFLTFDTEGRMFVAVTMVKAASLTPQDTWHSSTNEIAWLESEDGGKRFTSQLVTKLDLLCPRRYVSLERPTGYNRIQRPGLIYTSGHSRKDNREVMHNPVYWVLAPNGIWSSVYSH
jgi:hypothetical protein